MSDLVKQAGSSVWEWRMAAFWFVLFSVNSLCSAILLSFMNVDWGTLSTEKKWLVVVGILFNWTTTIMAFISKQASRIKQTGEVFPITPGDTTFTTKTTVNQQVLK